MKIQLIFKQDKLLQTKIEFLIDLNQIKFLKFYQQLFVSPKITHIKISINFKIAKCNKI